MFFFEKKNQKTFAHGPDAPRSHGELRRCPHQAKVFCFFFSKKKTFPSS
jgi:hypothetical protein